MTNIKCKYNWFLGRKKDNDLGTPLPKILIANNGCIKNAANKSQQTIGGYKLKYKLYNDERNMNTQCAKWINCQTIFIAWICVVTFIKTHSFLQIKICSVD